MIMRSGVHPLKRFSQNFLVDPNISKKIADSMKIKPGDCIVEIGAGEGMLTGHLLESDAKSVIAIEIDERLICHLKSRFSHDSRFHLIHQDFLKTDIKNLCPVPQKIRCAGNLPYGITSPILFHVLDNRKRIQDLTIMVQREVGERLTAEPSTKAYGIPSVLFQAVGDVHQLFTVSPKAFRPVPGVESVVLHICFHETAVTPVQDWKIFNRLVKTAFNQRRKMLRNTLKKWTGSLAASCIDATQRPEQLDIMTWIRLSNAVSQYDEGKSDSS